MQRRLFIRGGSAALAGTLVGCGGGGEDAAAGGPAGAIWTPEDVSGAPLHARKKPPRGSAPTTPPATSPDTTTPTAPTAPDTSTPTAPTAPEPTYTFQQEFNDASRPLLRADGGPFNPYYTYFGGPAQPDGPNGYRWWNDELQVYTTSQYTPAPYNPLTVRDGILTIAGKPTPPEFVNSPKPYVSGTLETSNGAWWESEAVRAARGGFEQKYGYWEARIRIPRGKGLWTGFWLAGGHIAEHNGKGGELDIFETVGDGRIHQTVHDWWGGAPDINDSYAYAPAWNYADDFHTYGLLWTANEIVWYVDGIETRRASATTVARYRDMCGPLYLCITLGIGGGWPGSPDSATPFPALMDIDYVRVRAA